MLARVRDPQQAARQLVVAANEHGGNDNVTVLVIDVLVGERGNGPAIAPIEPVAAPPDHTTEPPAGAAGAAGLGGDADRGVETAAEDQGEAGAATASSGGSPPGGVPTADAATAGAAGTGAPGPGTPGAPAIGDDSSWQENPGGLTGVVPAVGGATVAPGLSTEAPGGRGAPTAATTGTLPPPRGPVGASTA